MLVLRECCWKSRSYENEAPPLSSQNRRGERGSRGEANYKHHLSLSESVRLRLLLVLWGSGVCELQGISGEREEDKTHCKISLLNYLKDSTVFQVFEGIPVD